MISKALERYALKQKIKTPRQLLILTSKQP
jgi:hypothetical protein